MEADAKSHSLFPAVVLGDDWDCCCLEYIFLLRDLVSMRNALGLELGADRVFSNRVYGYAEYADCFLWDGCPDGFCDHVDACADHLEVEDVGQEEDWGHECVYGWYIVCSFSSHPVES